MRRLFGSLLILHGAAHAGAGLWITRTHPGLPVTILWLIATAGFVVAGIGLMGVPRIDREWRAISNVAATASLGLLALYVTHPLLAFGAGIDGAVLIGSISFVRYVLARQIGVPLHPAHRHLSFGGRSR